MIGVIALALAASPGAGHAAIVDLGAALASEESFRGIVQNNSLTASVRGDLRLAGGAYVGSRVLNNRSSGNAQMDFRAGARRTVVVADLLLVSLNAGLNANIHLGDRAGPDARDLDWGEVYASVGSGPLLLGVSFAPDYFGTGAAAWRVDGQLRWPLGPDTRLIAALAWNEGAGIGRYLARRGGDARYADIALGIDHELPADVTAFARITAASIELDDSRRPRLFAGLRWRWGRQFAGSTGR